MKSICCILFAFIASVTSYSQFQLVLSSPSFGLIETFRLEDNAQWYLTTTSHDFVIGLEIDTIIIRREDFSIYAEIGLPSQRLFTSQGGKIYMSFTLFDNNPGDIEFIIDTATDIFGNDPEVIILSENGNTVASFTSQYLSAPSDPVYVTNTGTFLRLYGANQVINIYTLPGTLYQPCCEAQPSNACPEDLNSDGIINVPDLLLLVSAFGQICEE